MHSKLISITIPFPDSSVDRGLWPGLRFHVIVICGVVPSSTFYPSILRLALVANGLSIKDVLKEYPELSEEDFKVCSFSAKEGNM